MYAVSPRTLFSSLVTYLALSATIFSARRDTSSIPDASDHALLASFQLSLITNAPSGDAQDVASNAMTTLPPIGLYLLAAALPAPMPAFIGLSTLFALMPEARATSTVHLDSFGLYTDNIRTIALSAVTANVDGSNNVAGSIYATNTAQDVLVGQIDSTGVMKWSQKQDTGANDNVLSQVVMGGALYSGGFTTFSSGSAAPYISKNNLTDGALLSVWTLSGLPGASIISAMTATAKQTLMCAGYVRSGGTKGYVFEFDPTTGVSSGIYISLAGTTGSYFYSIATTPDDGYILGGFSYPVPLTGWLCKLKHTSGVWSESWSSSYTSSVPGTLVINQVRVDSAGFVVLAGTTSLDGLVARIDLTTGQPDWMYSIGGGASDRLSSIAFKTNAVSGDLDELLLTGATSSNTLGAAAWMLVTSLNGTVLSSTVIDGTAADQMQCSMPYSDGTFTAFGTTLSYGSGTQLMTATLDANAGLDASLLPPGLNYSSNKNNMMVGAQVISRTTPVLTITPLTATVADITHSVTVTNNVLMRSWHDALTRQPSANPSRSPTVFPTGLPTNNPTRVPTLIPTMMPSKQPTDRPTDLPTLIPTLMPTHFPTIDPTTLPTEWPSSLPTSDPSFQPTFMPTRMPSGKPTLVPTLMPTNQPSGLPTYPPTEWPTDLPSPGPTYSPSWLPSETPSGEPTWRPTWVPTKSPTVKLTAFPSLSPTFKPTQRPSLFPSSVSLVFFTPSPTGRPSDQNNPTRFPTKKETESLSFNIIYGFVGAAITLVSIIVAGLLGFKLTRSALFNKKHQIVPADESMEADILDALEKAHEETNDPLRRITNDEALMNEVTPWSDDECDGSKQDDLREAYTSTLR